MLKLIWESKFKAALKRQQLFGLSVRDKRGKVLEQRYYPDINKRVSAALLFRWKPNQELNVLNAQQVINGVMQNSDCILKEVNEVLYGKNNYKININWNKLVADLKEYKNISKQLGKENKAIFKINFINSVKKSPFILKFLLGLLSPTDLFKSFK